MTENPLEGEQMLDLFRNTFRRHASGVVVLTANDPAGEPIGFTATSLASLSAVPARATFNVIKRSHGYRAIYIGNRVVVNFLGAESSALGELFAGPFERRFVGAHWRLEDGVPVVADAPVRLVTEIVDVYDQGDNAIVVVEIIRGHLGEERAPLLYHNRGFGTIASFARMAAA